jgi:hypothetical protein
MKKSIVFNTQFTPKSGGHFRLESGGQFAPKPVVNLTVFFHRRNVNGQALPEKYIKLNTLEQRELISRYFPSI